MYILPSLYHPPPTYLRLLKTQIRFLGDPSGQFNKDLDLTFESAAVFGQDRSKRYALVVEDGKVKSAHVEPDNTGVNGKGFQKRINIMLNLNANTHLQSPLPRRFSAASKRRMIIRWSFIRLGQHLRW